MATATNWRQAHENLLDDLRRRLKRHKHLWPAIERETGLSRITVRGFILEWEKVQNPGLETIYKISDTLDALLEQPR